ncbi:MAG: transposase [Okeania sp. SIO2D1]|nr:transposase [Okeania sp. SIO2D1]
MTKTKGFGPFNLAAKWKRTYRGWAVEEAWFILTNLSSIEAAIDAYQQRMGIEEMFRDFKSGGYNLEGTQVRGQRLSALILLITLAYCQAIFWGKTIQSKGISHYVARPTPSRRKYRQHSRFYIGLQGFSWLDSLNFFVDEMQELQFYAPQSRPHYQRGHKAIALLQSVF